MRKLSDQDKINIVLKYQTGKYTCAELGIEFNVTGENISRILKKRQVEIKKCCRVKRKYLLNENYFDVIDTENKAYFLGLMYADGYNNEDRGQIIIALQEDDKHILESLKKELETNMDLIFENKNLLNYKLKNQYRFRVCSKKMSVTLKKLGCPQKKSLILDFPTEEQVPSHLIRHFIRGYFDGDGCFGTYLDNTKYKTKKYNFSIVSNGKFCEKLKTLIITMLNIHCKTYIKHKHLNKSTKTVIICGRLQIYKFLDWIYKDATIYLHRKYDKYIEEKK